MLPSSQLKFVLNLNSLLIEYRASLYSTFSEKISSKNIYYIKLKLSVCVCVCVCSRLGATSFIRSQPKSARTEEGLRKKIKKIMHQVPSRGVDPRVKFLDDANATHSGSFEHTPTPVPCRPYASSSFAKLRAIEYLLPTKLTLLALSFLSKF